MTTLTVNTPVGECPRAGCQGRGVFKELPTADDEMGYIIECDVCGYRPSSLTEKEMFFTRECMAPKLKQAATLNDPADVLSVWCKSGGGCEFVDFADIGTEGGTEPNTDNEEDEGHGAFTMHTPPMHAESTSVPVGSLVAGQVCAASASRLQDRLGGIPERLQDGYLWMQVVRSPVKSDPPDCHPPEKGKLRVVWRNARQNPERFSILMVQCPDPELHGRCLRLHQDVQVFVADKVKMRVECD